MAPFQHTRDRVIDESKRVSLLNWRRLDTSLSQTQSTRFRIENALFFIVASLKAVINYLLL